ncbi:MAG: hypothetical protein OXM01_05860, partial [Gemmatimonadota bacterium]|nr:hypothetical protein [Gemmatimonadota bacterium]
PRDCKVRLDSANQVNTYDKSGLKCNSETRSWNRMSDSPPKALLNDPDVRRWHDNMRRSSAITCVVRLRRLNLFCHRVGMGPHELAKTGRDDPMKVENVLLDHVSWMEEKKYAPGYIAGVVGAVKSWLEYNHIEIRRKIKVANSDVPVSIQDEKIPDGRQLKKMLDAADPRSRVIISMMAFAGVRPQVMGLADKSDGLVLSDLPDLVLDGKDTRFSRMPAMVVVRPQLSKIRKKYFTFLTEEGCQYVLGYLRERMARGEPIKHGSPLVTTDHGYRLKGWGKLDGNDSRFLVTGVLGAIVRPVIRSVLKARPYALRAYFDSQLLIAESHGCMTNAYRQFFMGHKGDMEARYTTNKGRLTEQMTEDMRRAFEQSQPFLSTDATHDTETDKRRMLVGMWRQQARMYGLDIDAMLAAGPQDGGRGAPEPTAPVQEGGAARNDNAGMSATALEADQNASGAGEKAAAAGAAGGAASAAACDKTRHPFESRIADDESELLARTAEGWDLVRDLPGERFLIRRKIPRT